MINKLISRLEKWKEWRKYTNLSKFRQFCVLLRVEKNVHFERFCGDSYKRKNVAGGKDGGKD